MKTVRTAALGVALVVVAAAAQAQSPPVYRCGNAYSSTPCPDARVVDADDPRTPGQRADAAAVARDERRLGNAMSRERRRAEARRPAPAVSLGPSRSAAAASAASASLKPKKKAKGKIRVVDGDDFTATVPKPPKTRNTP